MNKEKLLNVFSLFLVLGYTVLVLYLVNKNYSIIVDMSLGVMLIYVWSKWIRLVTV